MGVCEIFIYKGSLFTSLHWKWTSQALHLCHCYLYHVSNHAHVNFPSIYLPLYWTKSKRHTHWYINIHFFNTCNFPETIFTLIFQVFIVFFARPQATGPHPNPSDISAFNHSYIFFICTFSDTIFTLIFQVFIVFFAGPQATGPYPNPSDISARLQKTGVQVYTVGMGRAFLQPEVLWTASYADYVGYKYDYQQILSIAEPTAIAVSQGRSVFLYRGSLYFYILINLNQWQCDK